MRSFSLRTREAICSKRWSAAPVADFSCEAAPLPARRERDAVPLERELLDREPLERPLLREPDARLEPDEPPDERRDPPLDDDELDLEPPLLACGTSPPLRGQRCNADTTSRRVAVARFRARAVER
jgi:hypothetical protein